MTCPRCGAENPDNAQACRACGARLLPPPVPSGGIVPKASGLAIAAFVLGLLSLFPVGLAAIPAMVLGIISFILIEKSGGRLTGRPFAVLAVILPVLLFGPLLWLILLHQREEASRMTCGTNLVVIGKAMLIYASDYDGRFPCSGGVNATWSSSIPSWLGQNRFVAYSLTVDGSQGQCTVSSCFYLLVKYAEVMPKSFICPGDAGATVFNPAADGAGDRAPADLWDFGPEPPRHCSYSYHQPFSLYPLTTLSEPGMAVAADRNPWMQSPAHRPKTFGLYNPDGGRKAIKAGNAIEHQEDGQNVLFLDNHVSFEAQPFCGVNDDNIYTYWDGADIRRGAPPIMGASKPKDKLDSLLVHDGHSPISTHGR
jgi:zinc-ribbon domain